MTTPSNLKPPCRAKTHTVVSVRREDEEFAKQIRREMGASLKRIVCADELYREMLILWEKERMSNYRQGGAR